MILELEDISERKPATAHLHLPDGMTLGGMFDKDPRMSPLKDYVFQCSINGAVVKDWTGIAPGRGDKVRITFRPGIESILAFLGSTAFMIGATPVTWGGLLAAISSALSVVSFFVQLFLKPQAPAPGSRPSRPRYTFEGLKTTFAPGNPVPVIYGQERTGGQLLALDLSPAKNRKGQLIRQEMSMLIGIGEGPITEVNCFRINDIDLTTIGGGVSTDFRLGTTSQGIIPGFETIRNTFADGREITGTGTSGITYSTNGDSLVGIELQVTAAEGLIHRDSDGTENSNWDEYSVEQRATGATTFSFIDNRRRFTAKTAAPIWQLFASSLSPPDAYDIRVVYLRGAHPGNAVAGAVKARGRLWLSNVTEIQGAGEPYSGTALVAFNAIATRQFHGGPPEVSVLVRGRTVKVFSTTAVSTITWSQNPAWCVLDYMTNSIYGMGAYVAEGDCNIQSFLDFAILCNSQVPNGKGGLENQHQLDLVMDSKKSHWDWVQNILGLYRSNIIYSQQQYKVISDRQDLPIRQVFHSGNIVRDSMEIKIGGDPMKPNQAVVNFTNQDLDYDADQIFVQDSASVLGAGDPIKDYEINLFGITRRSEAVRNASFDLNRRRQIRREVSFATGLEAVAVEPGDHARIGIALTDWEAGYGGRALDGSSRHIVLDREVTVKSGYTYDLFVWHTQADTVEQRTIATTVPTGTSCFSTITISPTAAFSYQVRPNDRWAIGITSEDLFRAVIKKVSRDDLGRHRIVAEEFRTVSVTTPTAPPKSFIAPAKLHPPAQPMGVVITEGRPEFRDGTIAGQLIVDVAPAPAVEGGRITVPGTTASVTLAQSHNPTSGALVGETLYFTSGPASGGRHLITSWGGVGTRVATVTPIFGSVPDSGDPYNLYKLTGEFAGFDFYMMRDFPNSESEVGLTGTYMGTRAEIPMMPQGGETTNLVAEIIPFSTEGIKNTTGTWVLSMTTFGDTVAPPPPSSIWAVPGTGKDVNIYVLATSCGDLWGHEFFRRLPGEDFDAGSHFIGFVGGDHFHDTDIEFEGVGYDYTARARDTSYNVSTLYQIPLASSKHVVVTFVASRLLTDDLGANAVSNIVQYAQAAQINTSSRDATDPTTVGFLTITTQGGPVLLMASFNAVLSDGGTLPIQHQYGVHSVLTVDSPGHTAFVSKEIQMTFRNSGAIGDADFDSGQIHPIQYNYLDSTSAGAHTYYLATYGTDMGSAHVQDVLIQAIELKR